MQAARFHEVWVIAGAFNEVPVKAELEKHPRPNVHFIFHPLPLNHLTLPLTLRSHASQYPSYLSWQFSALKASKRLHQEVVFDLTHHVTWASFRFPSHLAWLDAPFIWGPIGGGERAPPNVELQTGQKSAFGEMARNASTAFARFDPFLRHTARRASRILVATPETEARLPPSDAEVEVCPAIGLNLALPQYAATTVEHRDRDELRMLFAGRLTAFRGMNLAIQALARLVASGRRARLTLVGDGPERAGLEALARDLGLHHRVDFLGRRPRSEVLDLCACHDVFIFPSQHDSGGVAVLEAMALGLPVICLDLGGPALSVGDAGIRIACESIEQMIRDLARAMESLAADPALRQTLAAKARRRIEDHYDWNKKGEFLRDLYESVAAG
jgi:glycosyltransferase involved in cell wall biosynthesis